MQRFKQYLQENSLKMKHESITITVDNIRNGKLIDDFSNYIVNSFECINNGIISLNGLPGEVLGFCDLDSNPIESLIGCPKKVKGYFSCQGSNIQTLTGMPEHVGEQVYLSTSVKLTTIKGIGREFLNSIGGATIDFDGCSKLTSGFLDLFNVKGLTEISFLENELVQDIVNENLRHGNKAKCQTALLKNGLKEYC